MKVIHNSTYTSKSSVNKLATVAKNVTPDRMSLPPTAGIVDVDPRMFLKGHHLETFENLVSCVPHDMPPDAAQRGVSLLSHKTCLQ